MLRRRAGDRDRVSIDPAVHRASRHRAGGVAGWHLSALSKRRVLRVSSEAAHLPPLRPRRRPDDDLPSRLQRQRPRTRGRREVEGQRKNDARPSRAGSQLGRHRASDSEARNALSIAAPNSAARGKLPSREPRPESGNDVEPTTCGIGTAVARSPFERRVSSTYGSTPIGSSVANALARCILPISDATQHTRPPLWSSGGRSSFSFCW